MAEPQSHERPATTKPHFEMAQSLPRLISSDLRMTDLCTSIGALRQWVTAHPVMAFPLIYLGWAYLFWLPLLFSGRS